MAQRNQSLVLDISANIGGLQTTLKAGRSALLEFQSGAVSAADAVDKAFRDLGADGPATAAKRADAEFNKFFRSVGANARAIKAETDQAFATQLFDVGAADEQVRVLTRQAGQLRVVSAALEQASKDGGEFAETQGRQAIAAAAQARVLEQDALALDRTATAYRTATAGLAANDAATVRSTEITGQKRAALNQLSFQLGDVAQGFALGVSPATIFAQQIGQVTQAVQLLGGGTKGLAGFLGGPWGIALASAVGVLGPFIGKLFESGDAAEEAKSKTFDFSKTLDVLKLSANDAKTAMAQLVQETRNAIQVKGDFLASQAATAEQSVPKLEQQIVAKERQLRDLRGVTGANPGLALGVAVSGTARQLEAEIEALRKALEDAKQAVRNADLAASQRAAINSLDASAEANDRYNAAVGRITAQREASYKVEAAGRLANYEAAQIPGGYLSRAEYERQLRQLTEQKDRQIEEARKRERKTTDRGARDEVAFGNPLPGGRLTSGYGRRDRPTAGASANHLGVDYAAAIGTPVLAAMDGIVNFAAEVAGYGNQIELGHGAGTATRYSHLNGFNVKDGQEVRKGDVIGYVGKTGVATGPHLHYEVLVNGKKVDPTKGRFAVDATDVAEKGDQEQRRLAEQAARRVAAFAEATADADREILDAKLALVTDAGEQASYAQGQLVLEAYQYKAALDEKVRRGELNAADGEALVTKKAIATNLKLQKLAIDEQQRKLDVALDLDTQAIAGQVALLKLQGSIATTAEQRRAVARQLLELELKERRLAAERLLRSNDPAEQARGQRDIEQLNRETPLIIAGSEQDNADPVQRYLKRLKDTSEDTKEALKQVQADGLQSLEDGLVGIITGTESVAGAFKKMANQVIADLIRIAVQKFILNQIFGGILGGIGGSTGGSGGLYVPAKAEGGLLTGPGTGTSDSILARLSNGEFVVNALATERHLPLLEAINDGRLPGFARGGAIGAPAFRAPNIRSLAGNDNPAVRPVVFDLRGAVMTADLLRQMEAIAQQTGRRAVLGGAALSEQRLRDQQMATLT